MSPALAPPRDTSTLRRRALVVSPPRVPLIRRLGCPMRKTSKRLLWAGTILVPLVGIPVGVWLSLTYQPSYYRAMVLQSREQREGKARKFVAQSLQLRNDICNEPSWE